jgi:hypothetical protein
MYTEVIREGIVPYNMMAIIQIAQSKILSGILS